MRELERKQKVKRRLYSTPALLVLTFITFLFIRGTYIVFEKKADSGSYVKVLEAKAENLRTKQVELEANLQSIETPEGIEKEIKAKYNVAKEGEHVVILVDKNATPEDPGQEKKAWYEKFWDAIMARP